MHQGTTVTLSFLSISLSCAHYPLFEWHHLPYSLKQGFTQCKNFRHQRLGSRCLLALTTQFSENPAIDANRSMILHKVTKIGQVWITIEVIYCTPVNFWLLAHWFASHLHSLHHVVF